ncbi:hypothetical protein PV328_008599 [Microctonus aethiopoides]|uniref:CIP2A N-terminal domain-containing protein n=1 Tax=Microctonus aethiopoides TaxID=144406 RepID=A0AA39KRE3_9HYME|nr:hypothetical protein PV328_008599 [Microctonus aethiopoides]
MSLESYNSAKEMSLKMDKYQNMKAFNIAALEYIKYPSETAASVLQRNLSILSTTVDLSIFDPGTIVTAEFYVSLYNLTNALASPIPLTWSVLDVLYNACRNSAARHALIHTYKFAPMLSRLLETNLIPEKRLRVLKLLQELTYGVKIHSQEAHLPHLIKILTQWIMQSKDEEIVSRSLGVLINLCYKNLPAIHILIRTVNTKALHKMLLTLQSNNVNTRVQCCKLLIIMEQMSKDIPDKFILEFVMVTFQSLVAALADIDVLLLRHIVEFFDDVRKNENSRSVLISYQNYADDVNNIIQQLEETSDPECTALIMEFLLSLIRLKIPSLIRFYPTYIKVAMEQVNVTQVSSKALMLIKTILIDSRRSKNFNDLVSELNLSKLMVVIGNEDDEMDGKSEKRSIELNSRLTELIQLLLEMSKTPNLRAQVTQAFSEQTMRRLLRPMLEQENLISGDNLPADLIGDSATTLHIYALALTADLAVQNSSWLTLYSELIQKKQIQMMIALALFTGDGEVKQKCLQLMASVSFPQECVTAVAKYMCELEPLVLLQSRTGITTGIPVKSENYSNIDMTPLFSLAQEGQLDAALEKINNLLADGKITDVTTSAVMELYEYKLAAMKHAERGIQASHEAANAHATCLQHRLAQVIAESSRLHQLLFYTQQNYEMLQADKIQMNVKLHEAEGESKKIHAIQRQEIHGLKKIVAEKSATIEQLSNVKNELDCVTKKNLNLETKIKDLTDEKMNLESKAKDMLTKNHELNKFVNKLQDNIGKKDQIIEIKEKELAAGQEGMLALKQENEQLMRQCQSYEKTIAEKDENVQKLTNELIEFSRMRDMIYHLTAKKKDNQNETS